MDVADDVARLARGAAAWADRDPAARATVVIDTARSVALASAAWVEAALGIKAAAGPDARAAVFAEEMSTGPLATLRLLLVTARALTETSKAGLPRLARAPQMLHAGSSTAQIAVDVLPAIGPTGSLHDTAIFSGHQATVRCVDPGGVDAFARAWREEVRRRPASRGVALVLGAGNVTGLAAADCLSQIFEHGRAVFLKLHPLHETLVPVFREALAPLIEAGLLVVHAGGPDVVDAVLADSSVGHVHLTGGRAAFDAIVWGTRDHHGPPVIRQSITCELGNVTPWFIVPGRYTARQLVHQADLVAASIANNTSFNCIATKVVVTARSWSQRDDFLSLIHRRLAGVRARPGWYPGAKAAWEAVTERQAPADGTLPWVCQTGVDPLARPQFVEREWFVPVAAEVPLAADSIEAFCTEVHDFVARLPGSLAASVTVPDRLLPQDAARVELLIEHLPFGTVAVNTWSALAYALGSAPWGGYPGATLADPKSGIGFVHDPLCLPLVHNTIVRGPLAARLMPAWFPWHPHAAPLARGLLDAYASMAWGGRGLWPLLKLLPAVLRGCG
jgi:acyl-CoA reductase-like NAD-dependent aldehyde dehydrogenase